MLFGNLLYSGACVPSVLEVSVSYAAHCQAREPRVHLTVSVFTHLVDYVVPVVRDYHVLKDETAPP